jgi:uncharacterized protein (TIGR02611 family)
MKSSTTLLPVNRSSPSGDGLVLAIAERVGWVKFVRRLVVFLLGISVLLVGLVMIIAPGPAFVVIPLGLAILATEFVWARTILDALKKRLLKMKSHAGAPIA